jgi:hypothetical protein
MKSLFIIILFLSCSIAAYAQVQRSDLEQLKLTGPVKKIYENCFNIIEDSGLLKKGSLAGIIEATFNKEGYLTEEIISNNSWEPISRIAYTYENNKLIKKVTFNNRGDYVYTSYKYDADKKQIRETEYAIDETVKVKRISSYDKNGNLYHQAVTEFRDKKLNYEIFYKYDDKNLLIELASSTTGTDFSKETYEYDDFGLLLKKNSYKGNDIYVTIEYKYVLDKLLNWIKQYEIPSIAGWEQSFFRERNITYY